MVVLPPNRLRRQNPAAEDVIKKLESVRETVSSCACNLTTCPVPESTQPVGRSVKMDMGTKINKQEYKGTSASKG